MATIKYKDKYLYVQLAEDYVLYILKSGFTNPQRYNVIMETPWDEPILKTVELEELIPMTGMTKPELLIALIASI